jgi:hypothetical protein
MSDEMYVGSSVKHRLMTYVGILSGIKHVLDIGLSEIFNLFYRACQDPEND